MSSKSKLRKSRQDWKGKAITRGQNERYQRKENVRLKKERDRYKKEDIEAKKQLEKELRRNAMPVCNKGDIVYISLNLFLVARIGFRAVARVLGVLSDYLGIAKAPCPQTIINWLTRLSITRIQNAVPQSGPPPGGNLFSNGFIWIIDISIGLGSGKILTVLALNANHHALNDSAPTLQKIKCIAVAVASSWTGETIADFLQKVIATSGRPAAYLKDGGTDLAKAVRLLSERKIPGHCIDDISHMIANLLKHEYQNHPMFETFMSACGKISKKFKQTILACLAPPKVSTKARFMNLHRLVKWADQLLRHSPKGRAREGSMLSKLRAGIGQLPECKAFIRRFMRDANSLLACQKILKTKGLSQDSYRECRKLIEPIPPQSAVRTGFINWMEKQLMVAAELGLENTGMPVSSDNIESLFGISKQHGTGEIKDANRIALRIPAMCGELTREDVQMVLGVSVKEQQKIVGSLPSLTKQRRDLLPNPGCLDKVLTDETKENIELVAGSKKRSKNSIKLNITDSYEKSIGALTESEKRAVPFPEFKISNALTG